ncbi:MAG: Succinyl-CoA--L-malate CoA-transferase beta subunit [Anaerolineae bacterium]|nr:Succinyl-CoA--L-malate CoA-transferase beta subunit [Anaerolineae bacterium]
MTNPISRPLSGIRVIGLEQYMSGPYCTMLLADAGAEVIKIERPGSGDPRRAIPPFVEKNGVKKAGGYLSYNRNKKSLALNLRSKEGQAIVRQLVARADVVVENLRPGATENMGLTYEALKSLNPRLVYAMISGFGRLPGYQSDYSQRPAFDIVAEAMSGVMDLVGFADKPPTYTLYGMADVYSGMIAAYGVMQALFMRERTGAGQLVDVSMLDNVLALNERMVTLYAVTGKEPRRGELEHLWPRGAFKCRDGYVALNVPDDIIWQRLAATVGRPDLASDPRSATGTARAENAALLQPILEGWMADKTRAEVVDRLNAAGVPTGPVYSAGDVFADDHFRTRRMLVDVPDPEVGPTTFARTTPHLSAAPDIPTEPAPNLGQHTRSILTELLDYTDAKIDALVAAGVVAVS